MNLFDLEIAIQKNKLPYYIGNFLKRMLPAGALANRLREIDNYGAAEIYDRVGYYNKLPMGSVLGDDPTALKDILKLKSPSAYRYDTFEYSRFFPGGLNANFLFGDVINTPEVPTIQKSRPVAGDNRNAVLLKLDKKRHYLFVKDKKPFIQKKDLLIGRSAVNQEHRVRFMEMYFNHPLCNLGQVNTNNGKPDWVKPKTPISTHLDYKFILSLEGWDVATNLKWIMSSNSIAVMPKPKYETWYMEGRLIPDHHYICIKDDYSDLEERLNHYIAHEQDALTIISNANAWVKQFQDKRKEDLISLLVLQKYFECTGQPV
ncbi:glycosyl transferase family 90 [Mucilaginibacter aquatilis]|uniref:Lipopolysaccharide biosynthesis protein n=1 Tax=Mucilaginibacter aquatilis TaxID=1517760 RepID=A0A6I4IPU8_9SPHI|nr:glycosyl transferase family 90 [Mucilaginibacter aquatilis]MVN90643.1 lipopolysaccharide biosynthesis protein [Mucilaginibacter aquatilis]